LDIPEKLLNLPTHIVEVFLADIAPYDEEYVWNHYTNEAVHKWFANNFDERSYIIGKVSLYQNKRKSTKKKIHNMQIRKSCKNESS
jgi:hypothetical protein